MKRCSICGRHYPTDERFCSIHGLPLVSDIPSATKERGELSGYVLDGRYRLEGVAGRGGMGIVYEAEHLRIGRRCAVKIIHQEYHADVKMRMRLFREMQAASRIRHPNIVEIIDFGENDFVGTYMVMEYLEGQSLSACIREQKHLFHSLACKIAIQLTAALAAIHAQGLIHRDLKPSNIYLLSTGQIKVLDFGLVKPFAEEAAKDFVTITTGSITFGTPWYMSPEQATFQELDPRTDIYSLGIILYEMLVGHPPFRGNNPIEVLEAHRNKPVPLPNTLDPPIEIPPRLEMIITKSLQKKPQDRFQSMVEMMDALCLADPEAHPAVPLSNNYQLAVESTAPISISQAFHQEWTLPVPRPGLELQQLREIVLNRLDELAEPIAQALRNLIPRYQMVDLASLKQNIKLTLTNASLVFNDEPLTELPESMRRISDERTDQNFTPTEIIGALWLELSMMRPLIREVAGNEVERYTQIETQLDQRILSFILTLIDYYFSRFHSRLVHLNEVLAKQNEELIQLRSALTDQVKLTTRQLMDAEQLNTRVVETVPSGLILVERHTHLLKIFNQSMTRLSGIPAEQALGRPIEDVLASIEGIPFDEFMEQLRLHGEVGLRKLWVRFPTGIQRAVYVRGQSFLNKVGEQIGTLFVVDDVTEREQIIESFSRYLSREVVERILRRRETSHPEGEARQMVFLVANIRHFRSMMKNLPIGGVVEMLSDYVRTLGETFFHHGGVIHNVIGERVVVYFDHLRETFAPAVNAAIELISRLETLNQGRQAKQQPPIQVGVGIHVGEVLVLNVGSKRRMVHTLVGDVALIAQALQQAASDNEIMISPEIAEKAGPNARLEIAPPIVIEGQPKPLEAFRVLFSPVVASEESGFMGMPPYFSS
jgi:PAS domain S-box-containing protein